MHIWEMFISLTLTLNIQLLLGDQHLANLQTGDVRKGPLHYKHNINKIIKFREYIFTNNIKKLTKRKHLFEN